MKLMNISKGTFKSKIPHLFLKVTRENQDFVDVQEIAISRTLEDPTDVS